MECCLNKSRLMSEVKSDLMEFSHTDSTNQTEPCECPLCTRKMILPRRASLRSSKRNIEAEKTSSSTCSQPQKKSRQHSSATDREPKTRQEKSEKFENSVTQVEIEKELLAKPITIVGCSSSSSPSISLKLTEVVNKVDGEDDDDEVDSVTPLDVVDGYRVKPEYIPILKRILSKYGDIAKTIVAIEVRSSVMEMICGIISELKEIDLYKIKEGFLLSKIAMVNEIRKMNVEIEWLHHILDEMLEARKLLERCVTLKEYKDNNIKVIENAQREMDEYEEQKEELATKFRSLCDKIMVSKETWEKAMEESTRIKETIKYALSKVKRFTTGSLVDLI